MSRAHLGSSLAIFFLKRVGGGIGSRGYAGCQLFYYILLYLCSTIGGGALRALYHQHEPEMQLMRQNGRPHYVCSSRLLLKDVG